MSEKKVYTANEIEEVKDEINLQVVLQELKKSIEKKHRGTAQKMRIVLSPVFPG